MSTAPHVPGPAAAEVSATVTPAATPMAAHREPGEGVDRAATDMLRGLDTLETLPVADHVAVLEAAHDRLREALTTTPPQPAQAPADAPPDAPADAPPDPSY